MRERTHVEPLPLQVSLAATAANCAVLRRAVADWLGAAGAALEEIDNMRLVASELFTNAVEATTGGHPINVEARCADRLMLAVTNVGSAFNALLVGEPGPLARRGRGLALIRRFGAVTSSHTAGRTTVTFIHD